MNRVDRNWMRSYFSELNADHSIILFASFHSFRDARDHNLRRVQWHSSASLLKREQKDHNLGRKRNQSTADISESTDVSSPSDMLKLFLRKKQGTCYLTQTLERTLRRNKPNRVRLDVRAHLKVQPALVWLPQGARK